MSAQETNGKKWEHLRYGIEKWGLPTVYSLLFVGALIALFQIRERDSQVSRDERTKLIAAVIAQVDGQAKLNATMQQYLPALQATVVRVGEDQSRVIEENNTILKYAKELMAPVPEMRKEELEQMKQHTVLLGNISTLLKERTP